MERDIKGCFVKEVNRYKIEGETVTMFTNSGEQILFDLPDLASLLKFKWSINKVGVCKYAVTNMRINGKMRQMKMHRFILSAPRELEVDHKDNNGLNNSRSNLRIAESRFNKMNLTKYSTNTSGYKGVHLVNGHRWQARIQVFGKRIPLGCYCTPQEAANAYNEAAIKYHGEFAHLNII